VIEVTFNGTKVLGKLIVLPVPSVASKYVTSPVLWIVTPKLTELLLEAATVALPVWSFKRTVNVYGLDRLNAPVLVGVAANVHVTVQAACDVQVDVAEALSEPTTSLLFTSSNVMLLARPKPVALLLYVVEADVEVAMALPLKVSFKVFNIAAPEEFGVNVMLAMLLTEDFVRPDVVPNAVALGVSVVRRTVIMLLVPLPVTVVAIFELAPSAVTLPDAIVKVDVELSVEPCEL
jgi:hypothetical protein